jgi:hypothetical protein
MVSPTGDDAAAGRRRRLRLADPAAQQWLQPPGRGGADGCAGADRQMDAFKSAMTRLANQNLAELTPPAGSGSAPR